MEDINLKPVVAIVIISGLLIYFLNAIWAMHYTGMLPLEEDFCSRWAAEQTGTSEGKMFCDIYKNRFEELKHQDNLNAEARVPIRNLILGFLGPVIGVIAFFIAVRRRKERSKDEKYAKEIGVMDYLGPVVLGFAATALIPVLLNFVVPEPARWMPNAITEGVVAKLDARVEELRVLANN